MVSQLSPTTTSIMGPWPEAHQEGARPGSHLLTSSPSLCPPQSWTKRDPKLLQQGGGHEGFNNRGEVTFRSLSSLPSIPFSISSSFWWILDMHQSKEVPPLLTPYLVFSTNFPVLFIKEKVSRHGGKVGPLGKQSERWSNHLPSSFSPS